MINPAKQKPNPNPATAQQQLPVLRQHRASREASGRKGEPSGGAVAQRHPVAFFAAKHRANHPWGTTQCASNNKNIHNNHKS